MDTNLQRGEMRVSIAEFLKEHSVLSLATVFEGYPHSASLIYAPDVLSLYWFSSPDSRHSIAISKSPIVSITIARQYTDFSKIRGVQMRGVAHRMTDSQEINYGSRIFMTCYPNIAQFLANNEKLNKQYTSSVLYRFDPEEITLIDNNQGFGFKQSISF